MMIKWFEAITIEDFELVGGKGYNLSKMVNEGIAVPKGYVILSSAYDAYITSNGLKEKINLILESAYELNEQSEAIKSLFVVDLLDKDLKRHILEAYKKIPSGRVAVRSSSTVEDLPGMSFAGQYSSYLNVKDKDILAKVIKCWQSLWNDRAIHYRNENNITDEFSHAVVVQEMVNASVSGVAFTANPISGVRDELVINASYGLGEAIVSGEVNPDQYVISKETSLVIESTINQKEVLYRYDQKGIALDDVDVMLKDMPALNLEAITMLVDMCKKVEAYFKKPQDIEFAFDENRVLYILQSRDITTLFPIERLKHDGKLRPYMSGSTVLLGMKEPFTPLGFDVMSYMIPTIVNVMTARKKKLLTNSFIKYEASRMYIDMSYLMSSKLIGKQFGNALSGNDLPIKGVMHSVIDKYGKTLSHQGIRFRLPLGIFKYGFFIAGKIIAAGKIPNDKRYDALIAEGNKWYDVSAARYNGLSTIKDKLDFTNEILVEAFKLSQVQSAYCLDVNNLPKIEKALKKYFNDEYEPIKLIQSVKGCFTQTMMVMLNEHAKYLEEHHLETKVNAPQFQEILAIYGHRANIELDFGTPRWREDPTYLLGLVDAYRVDKMYERNLKDCIDKRLEAEAMIEEIYKRLLKLKGKKIAESLRLLMVNYRYGIAMREYPKSDIVRFMELARKAAIEVGQELVDNGILDHVEDVFYLHKEEILEGKNLRATAKAHRELYNKEMKRTSIPRVVLNNGATYYSSTVMDKNARVLQGMALSPGIYEGRVRVVYNPVDTKLVEGEILVTESTNPAWTPLFATAGALVMEYGGPMSHGGIVAREYGIPAVVGIPSAMDVLKDGQLVRVNGETGTIEIMEG